MRFGKYASTFSLLPALYNGEDAATKASPTPYTGKDAVMTASPTPFTGEDGVTKASPTLYVGEDGAMTASPPLYGGEDDLLFGVDFVLGFAVFSSQEGRKAVAIDRVDWIGDAIAGAEDVRCGLEARLVLVDEDGFIAIATAVGDFGVTEVGVEEQLLRLEEAPIEDEAVKTLTGENFDGAAQFAIIDREGGRDVLCIEEIGGAEDSDD